ncbi:MAG: 50S ribosomal protein L7ae [Erysipelothrix sp.]|nr:50S ribosomal protein L7ae [Erysipelothrix sp.]
MKQYETTSLSPQVLNRLGISQAAGKLASGEQVMKSIRSKDAKLVIIASDASDRTKKQLTNKCTFYNIQFVISFTIAELSHAIGKTNRVAVSILDSRFAKMILKENEEVML